MRQPLKTDDQADILIVDDTLTNLKVLTGMLKERGYKTRPIPSGKLALQAVRNTPPDLILLDINMPEMTGYEVCAHLKADEKLKDIPVIFISAISETIDKVKGFSIGGVDYITKPFQVDEVLARVETHLKLHRQECELVLHNHHLEELVQAQVKEISESQMATIFAISKLAESRDDDTGKHLDRVRIFCRLLAENLAENPKYRTLIQEKYLDNIAHASPLHDIGKVAISDAILLKPEKLTAEEFTVMQTHTTIGAQTLQIVLKRYPKNHFINMGISIARSHHERWDGGGYPEGIKGEAIPLSARIMAVADVYDALRSKRPYKEALTHGQTREIIYNERGTHFDPDVVASFLDLEKTFLQVSQDWED